MSRLSAALAIMALGAFVISFTAASAQPPGGAPSASAVADQQLAKLNEKIKLTAAQKAKLKPIIESTFKQAQTIFNDPSLDQPKKFAKLKAMQAGVEAKIKAVLTPEQQKKFVALQKEAAEKMKAAGAPRQPR